MTIDTFKERGSLLVGETVCFVVNILSDVTVCTDVSVDLSVETEGHSTKGQGTVSFDSPTHLPPFLAGITTALILVLKDFPQVVEHLLQSAQTDHKQSDGNTVTFMVGSVEAVVKSGLAVTAFGSTQVLVSGPKINAGGQVQTYSSRS